MAHLGKEQVKLVRAQLNRRPIDCGQLSISVNGSVIYITGVVRALRGHESMDLRDEMNTISNILRQRMGVAEVVWDVTIRT